MDFGVEEVKFISALYSLLIKAMENKRITDVYDNQKVIEKRLKYIEEQLKIEPYDEKLTPIEDNSYIESLNDLKESFELEIVDNGKTIDGEYFRIKYLDKNWQVCIGEIGKDNINEIDNDINEITFKNDYPSTFSKVYFVILSNSNYNKKNIKNNFFELQIKFNNKGELENFKENITTSNINYFALGEW